MRTLRTSISLKSIVAGLYLVVAALVATANAALAAPITVPTGLIPGDTYRLAFSNEYQQCTFFRH
ncbi:MAG: hypothetical protein HN478_15890 [Rhodospirillaceae bacterium]|jgi:hypothetical protein|nr:hypothetical protein [Rhodospirillaceae bacterium]